MKAAPEGQGQGASLAEEDQYKAAIGSGPLQCHPVYGYSGDRREEGEAEDQERQEVQGGDTQYPGLTIQYKRGKDTGGKDSNTK